MSMKTVFLFDPTTFEFKGAYDAQESPEEAGVFIEPTHSTVVVPPSVQAKQIQLFSVEAEMWSVVPDFRGDVFYHQDTGAEIVWEQIGSVPLEYKSTRPAPTSEQMLINAAYERDSLLALAVVRIGPLQDAVDMDEATSNELAQLTAWKKYRVALNRLDLSVNPIAWPSQPA